MRRIEGSAALAVAVLCLAAGPASGQLRVTLGGEYFRWKEATAPGVEEKGGLVAAGLEYTQRKEAGLLFGYRGRVYTGATQYDGVTLRPPQTTIKGTTEYAGMTHEGQVRYRFGLDSGRGVDVVVGAGADLWRRQLSRDQKEDFLIGFARLGIESEPGGPGWIAGGGVKYPFYTWENAHLTDIGFGQNPRLSPGKLPSLYAHVGYRFEGATSLVFYVDSYRFSASDGKVVDDLVTGPPPVIVFQPASTQLSVGAKIRYEFE